MVAEKVKEIISAQLGCKSEKLQPGDLFSTELCADDFDMTMIIAEIEGEFNIEIPDTAAAQIFTVGDLIKYVEERVKNGK